jgi:hypothetical protein
MLGSMPRANGPFALLISPFLMLLVGVATGPFLLISGIAAFAFALLIIPVELVFRASKLKPAPLKAFSWLRACATGAATAIAWVGIGQLLWIYSGPGQGALIPAAIASGVASSILTAAATFVADLISGWRTTARLPKVRDPG